MKKKLVTAISATLLTITMFPTTANVFAKAADFKASTKNTTSISVRKVDYDLDKNDASIDIDFAHNIKLKSDASIVVKDQTGKKYSSYIDEFDPNEIDLNLTKLSSGKDYTVTIKGIRKSTAKKYGTLTIKFSVPKASNSLVKDVDYDVEDQEVSFDFKQRVTYKNVKVKITNLDGTKSYSTYITEKDSDELSVHVSNLVYGKKYKYTITGVSADRSNYTKSYSGTFTAID